MWSETKRATEKTPWLVSFPSGEASRKRDRPVVIAMIAVRVVQSASDEIVVVVAVWHFLVAAIVVLAATLDRRARNWICRTHGDDMFVVVPGVRVMEMAVV